ncbi:hypothetical protein [Candidatus Kuenenia stuttgartiensis]|uniref:Uncharacterized protein n=1 Tax=Kuenenia stuttgartiensis TaxID=174633 RepID=Q1PVC0_KUEST|nr:hypothetical protein [Candidatus Kuenenia stuttgartiensis]CAJ71168.1 unknown protein [Candidatus Kuenenia stuttgartiensis]
MTNKFQLTNRDFVIWELAFYHSTWPHYTHKLIGSGYKPDNHIEGTSERTLHGKMEDTVKGDC